MDQPANVPKLVADHCVHPWANRRLTGQPSQDAALSGTTAHGIYAIVCDGVSGGKYTHLGANLVATLVEETLTGMVPDDTPEWAQNMAQGVHAEVERRLHEGARLGLGLALDHLYCTTLFAFVRNDTGAGFAHIIGDGVVAFLGPEKADLSAVIFNWNNNVPFTLAHMANPEAFRNDHTGSEAPLVVKTWSWEEGAPVESSSCAVDVEQGMRGITLPFTLASPYSGVVLMSDGVTQIGTVSPLDAIREFTAFKSMRATFLQQRFSFGLATYQATRNQQPQDDLGAAAIMAVPPPPPLPPPLPPPPPRRKAAKPASAPAVKAVPPQPAPAAPVAERSVPCPTQTPVSPVPITSYPNFLDTFLSLFLTGWKSR